MQLLYVFVSVECRTCKWYFALSLLACMFRCSFYVWMIIVITIYSDYSCLIKSCFIAIDFTTWSHCVCSICISRFLLTMVVLCYCFQVKLVRMFQELHSFLELGVSEFWQLFSNHMLSLESVLGFCHGIAKGGDCKVEFIQSCVGFISCQICL